MPQIREERESNKYNNILVIKYNIRQIDCKHAGMESKIYSHQRRFMDMSKEQQMGYVWKSQNFKRYKPIK